MGRMRRASVFARFAGAARARVANPGSDGFGQGIVIALQAGRLRDVALFARPGLARGIAVRGRQVPLAKGTRDRPEATVVAGPSSADRVTLPGVVGAV